MSKTSKLSESAAIRARLNFPIIDCDGHTIELDEGIVDYLKQVGGHNIVRRFDAWRFDCLLWYRLSAEERRQRRPTRISWWALPTKNTLDRATAILPKLRYERMDELGIDFSILYPSLGLLVAHIDDQDLRRIACRAFNQYTADIHGEYRDRMTPAAIIPMHTPDEAIEELEYSVNSLGMKVILLASYVRRPLLGTDTWLDTYGIDSLHDYDSVWAKCLELKVVPTFHSTGIGWGSRTSVSNYIYNHIGSFAAVGEAVCKSLFLGGVTRRFPQLKFVFLEGGVGWACSLYVDLITHWRKRNSKDIHNYNPDNLNFDMLLDLYKRYGGNIVEGNMDKLCERAPSFGGLSEDLNMLDELARCQIKQEEDIRDLFVSNFYFGCEGDDPINSWAFNTHVNPFGSKLKILLGSDIGHWDVPDSTKVVEEAYEMVERGLLTENDFREFVFANPVSCYGGMNPEFFKDTILEKNASAQLTSG
jgi:predicted TIM-barrel fold metal-dependent hydrolase